MLNFDSETYFILVFHLSPYRDLNQAYTLLNSVKNLGSGLLISIVSDRYNVYKVTIKTVLGDNTNYIRV